MKVNPDGSIPIEEAKSELARLRSLMKECDERIRLAELAQQMAELRRSQAQSERNAHEQEHTRILWRLRFGGDPP